MSQPQLLESVKSVFDIRALLRRKGMRLDRYGIKRGFGTEVVRLWFQSTPLKTMPYTPIDDSFHLMSQLRPPQKKRRES
jgi:hypothetical protein